MNDQPTARTAYAEGTRLHWCRWKHETAEEFQARAIAEGERLGLPILFHQPRPARSGPPAAGALGGSAEIA